MLTRLSQIGIKLESNEGVEETLVAGDFVGNRKEHGHATDQTEYERELVRATLSPTTVLKAQRTGTVSWVEELAGGSAAGAPNWHRTLRAMGFKTVNLKFIELGSVQNPTALKLGQTVGNNASQGSATKTGIFVAYVAGTPARMVYMPVTGVFADTEQIFNYSSPQFSADIDSAPADAGFALTPQTETDAAIPASATVERRLGTFRNTIIGARGKGALTLRQGEPALLRAELMGAPVYDPSNPGRPRLAEDPVSPAELSTPPRISKGIPLALVSGGTEYTPILTQLEIALENTLAPRQTIANNDLAESGHMAPRITDRRYTINIDPELVLPAAFDFHTLLTTVSTVQVRCSIGTPTDANGMVAVWIPAAQRLGGAEVGDRDGRATFPGDWILTGSSDNELYVFHAFLT